MTTQMTLREAREVLGLSIKDLSALSHISVNTIYAIERNGRIYAVHEDTAALIATAMGCDVNEIAWPHGLSDRGRPPLTGVSIGHRASTNVIKVCPACRLQLAAVSSECLNC